MKLSEETKKKIGLANKGKIRSVELRKRISQILKGRSLSEETKRKMIGRTPWNKGKKGLVKMSVATRKKMSEINKGANHWNWQGGISNNLENLRKKFDYKLWRTNVLERDHYTCVQCGLKRGWSKDLHKRVIIQADHIKSFAFFPELRFDVSNGRALCVDCHKKTETYGAKRIYLKRRILLYES